MINAANPSVGRSDLSHVFQQDGRDGLGGVRHVDRAVVSDLKMLYRHNKPETTTSLSSPFPSCRAARRSDRGGSGR